MTEDYIRDKGHLKRMRQDIESVTRKGKKKKKKSENIANPEFYI